MSGRQEVAQTLALHAIGFIVQQEAMLGRFLGQTGLSLEDLKAALEKPETLAAVLDWLLQEDKSLLTFCEEFEVTPDLVWRVRNHLPGAPAQQCQSI